MSKHGEEGESFKGFPFMVENMTKVLIIGAAGFVGHYLANYLLQECHFDVHVTKLPCEIIDNQDVIQHNLDILNRDNIETLLFSVHPKYIFHLAAQSSVGVAWKNPGLTIDINVKGSLNVMDAARQLYYKPRILLIGSGEEYGYVSSENIPIKEDTLLQPSNIYAATKACQNMIGNIYANAYDMEVMLVRAFNHIGPSQAPMFVVSDFCKQIAEIEKEKREPVIYVGNLHAERDFTDVRDVVKAYTLLVEKGVKGETYNVGSGKAVSIQKILDIILSKTNSSVRIEIDRNKIRPMDTSIIEADITKIYKLTGWKPKITLEQTIEDTLEFWRKNVEW